jgi:TRAP transporter 4TM/12TM fusion protein
MKKLIGVNILPEGQERLTKFWRILLKSFTVIGILLAINQVFNLGIFGFRPIISAFLYYEFAIFLPFVYIINPKTRKIAWYDVALAIIAFVICVYFGLTALKSSLLAWEWFAPLLPTVCAVILWALLIEAMRRAAGKVLTIVCLIFSLLPLITGHLPGFLNGAQYAFLDLAKMHIISANSIFGMPMQVFGKLLIGFMVFGIVMKVSGCGDFFLNLSLALLGKSPGGPAKVACVSSGLLGSMSGSVLTNVMTTGSMTIPAMIKTGYDPKYAAAIEACSSTGATIMPPIMGAAAFIMATFIGVPYATIIFAALIPAILYYWGIYVQIDCYARRKGMKGVVEDGTPVPSLWKTIKEGWYFIFAFVLLCYLLIVLRYEAWAPYFTSVALLLLACIRKETRLNKQRLLDLIQEIGETLSGLIATIAGVGLILGALSITGIALAFSRELVALVGNNALLILIAGALTSFILGMGMTATACYIFLSVVMAPAIVTMGFNVLATHLFIFYWGMISYITPPLALAVFGACGISKSDPWKTGWLAVRMGIVAYLIPFFFIYDPSLIGQGPILNVLYTAITALIGVWLLSSGLEGYISKAGTVHNWWIRILVIAGGFLMFMPGWITDLAGVALAVLAFIIVRKQNRASQMVEA